MRARTAALAAIVSLAWGCEGKFGLDDPGGTARLPDQTRPNAEPGPDQPDNSTTAPDPFPDLPCEGVACETAVPSLTPRVTRLTHHQWENATRDLLRLSERPGSSRNFLKDTLSVGTFDRMAEDLSVSPGLWDDYREAAETLAAEVASDPEALARLVPEEAPDDFDGRARAFVEEFGKRAYRRPLADAEIESYLGLMGQASELFGGAESFEKAAELAIRAFLQSPDFLYRLERHSVDGQQVVALNGFERASRLSFALWNTIPDEQLLAAAAAGDLDDHETLAVEVARMLDDPRARDVIVDFHAQLLALHHFAEMSKNEERFPSYNEQTPTKMERELEMFVDDVVFEADGTFRDLMTARHSFVDSELADIYGVSDPGGDDFVRVELDDTRPGLLTRAGFLALNATAYDPNPIHRGVFVDERILCMDLPLPPDNFSIPDGVEGNTNRERIDNATRECGGACHVNLINPPGFAFETYDALGAHRTMDNGYPVDTSGELVFDGETRQWDTGPEFIGLLAESRQAHACYAEHWFEYVNGRLPNDNDEPLLARLAQASFESDTPIKELLVAIVSSDVFLKRSTGGEE